MPENYRLDSLENNEFRPIKDLSESEFREIEEGVQSIMKFNKQFLFYVYFQLNLIEFDKLVKKLSDVPISQIDIQIFQNSNHTLNINRVVFNLLSSFKFFLDGSETEIKRRFGKTSKESEQFIATTRKSFDNSFSYRFLSKLRHYSQHIGFPIHLTSFKATENLKEPHKMKGNFRLIIDREKLLEEKDLFGKIVSSDLEQLKDNIDLEPLIYELGAIVLNIEKLICNFYKVPIEKSFEYLYKLAKEYKTKTNQLVVIYNISVGSKYHQFNTLPLPFDEMEAIDSFINWTK